MKSIALAFSFSFASIAFFSVAASANPSALTPDKALAAHGLVNGLRPGCEDAKGAVKRLYDLYFAVEERTAKAFERKSNPSTIPADKLSKDWAELGKAQRDAAHLLLMGEPAASDLSSRLATLRQQVGLLVLSSGSTPTGSRLVLKALDRLKRSKPKNDKILAKQQEAINNGQFESAEKALESLVMKVDPDVAFLAPSQRKPYAALLYQLMGACTDKLDQKRVVAYRQQARSALGKNLQDIQQLDAEMARIVSELQSGGKAAIGENDSATPIDAIDHLDQLWGNASAALLRNWSIQRSYGGEPSDEPMRQLTSTTIGHLKSIISAAAKVPTENPRGTYAAIIEKITTLDRRSNQSVSAACESELGQLAAADPSLPAQISAYEEATAEILRWRKKFARQQAKRLTTTYPILAGRLGGMAVQTEHRRAPMFRGPGSRPRPLTVQQISGNCSWTVYESGKHLIGNRVSDSDTIRTTSRTSVVPFKGRYYASVAVGLPLDAQIESLKADLLLDDEHAPLSLDAAAAIGSAELREYDSFGGIIRNVHMEPTAVRFISLPSAASAIAVRTVPPDVNPEVPAVSDACWRVDLSPHWVQHDYFVVEIKKYTMSKQAK